LTAPRQAGTHAKGEKTLVENSQRERHESPTPIRNNRIVRFLAAKTEEFEKTRYDSIDS
jgi:hypothetical protein